MFGHQKGTHGRDDTLAGAWRTGRGIPDLSPLWKGPVSKASVAKLSPDQVDEALKALPEWAAVGEAIQRTYQFNDFVTSMKFATQVAAYAEQAQHHPDLLIRYSRVTVTLATHDAGGISAKDMDSARAYDAMALDLPCQAPVVPPPARARKKK